MLNLQTYLMSSLISGWQKLLGYSVYHISLSHLYANVVFVSVKFLNITQVATTEPCSQAPPQLLL